VPQTKREKIPSPEVRALRAARERAGISRDGIALELDVAPTTVWRWETGLTAPHPVFLRLWKAVLSGIEEGAR
jgi:transcriptional regulator with XRE-family HTH domain